MDWRIFLGVAAIPSLIGLVFRFYMPESPRWLIRHEKYDKAIASLKRFNITAQLSEIKNTHKVLLEKETKMKNTPMPTKYAPRIPQVIIHCCILCWHGCVFHSPTACIYSRLEGTFRSCGYPIFDDVFDASIVSSPKYFDTSINRSFFISCFSNTASITSPHCASSS